MAVYYHLCGEIGSRAIHDTPNVYGGWRSIPSSTGNVPRRSSVRNEQLALAYQQNYHSAPFSSAAWFQQFLSFNDAIRSTISKNRSKGYVIVTDVANFYDSIDVGRLIRKLRKDVSDLEPIINLLEVFLGYWNRRTSGYQQSSRGIPQEIISDGSRNLSHYYLQEFDRKILSTAKELNVVYMRWADDMIFFGHSVQALERCVYSASQYLLADGLNLNASKTKTFSYNEFQDYRGLRLLHSIETNDRILFRRRLRRLITKPYEVKIDTIFRAIIGYANKNNSKIGSIESNFIFDCLDEKPDLIGGLNSVQLYRIIKLARDPVEQFEKMLDIVESKQVTAPKAVILSLIRKAYRDLRSLGLEKRMMIDAVEKISASANKSDVLKQFCVPSALLKIEKLE